MQSEKVFLTIGIFSLLAAGLFFISAFDVNLTGKVIDSGETGEKAIGNAYCKENDNGISYGVRGKIEYCDESECSDREDFCEGSMLIEWYCDGNVKNYVQYNCESGCDVGACLANAKKSIVGIGGSGGSGSSGGSSSRGGSSVSEPTGSTFNLGNLENEETLSMAKYDIAEFSISGKNYVLNIKDVSEIQISATVSNTQFDLQVGDELQIDLDGDNDNDLNVKLRAINLLNNNAKITLRAI